MVGLHIPAQQPFCFCMVAGLVAEPAQKAACGCISVTFLSCPQHPVHGFTGVTHSTVALVGGAGPFQNAVPWRRGSTIGVFFLQLPSCPSGSAGTPCAVPPSRPKSSTGETRGSLVASTLHQRLHHLPAGATSLARSPFPSHPALPLLPSCLSDVLPCSGPHMVGSELTPFPAASRLCSSSRVTQGLVLFIRSGPGGEREVVTGENRHLITLFAGTEVAYAADLWLF